MKNGTYCKTDTDEVSTYNTQKVTCMFLCFFYEKHKKRDYQNARCGIRTHEDFSNRLKLFAFVHSANLATYHFFIDTNYSFTYGRKNIQLRWERILY